MNTAEIQSDHDLLVELRTEMRGMRNDIKELKEGTTEKLADHEMRIRANERKIWVGSAVATLVGTGLSYLMEFIIFHH